MIEWSRQCNLSCVEYSVSCVGETSWNIQNFGFYYLLFTFASQAVNRKTLPSRPHDTSWLSR